MREVLIDSSFGQCRGALYLFGFINYQDGLGQRREMGFCRRYDPETRRFKVVDDPNYEYAD